MELKYSTNQSPYIDLGNGMLIFSKITEHPKKGFKYLVFQSRQINSVCVSGSKAKNKKYAEMSEDICFTIDMDFKRKSSGKESGIPKNARYSLTTISETILKKIFKDFIVDGYFPRENLPKLEENLKEYWKNDTDEWDDDPTATESYDDIGETEKKEPKRKLALMQSKVKIKPKIKLKGQKTWK